MSVKIIPLPVSSINFAPPDVLEKSPENEFWQERSVQGAFLNMSKTDASRFALRLFGTATFGTGATIATLSTLGTLTLSTGLLSVPCLITALGVFWYSSNFGDYENPEELEKFRRSAQKMNLDQVAHSYGWTNVLQWGILPSELFVQKYRQFLQGKDLMTVINYYEKVSGLISNTANLRFEYPIPTPRECRGQWRQETANKPFEEIIQIYPLEKLEKYNILEVGELKRLKELKRDFDALKAQRDNKLAAVDREFQNSTSSFTEVYRSACFLADLIYSNHPAVKKLQTFEIDYIRERQVVQDTLTRSRAEIAERFNRAVAPINGNGQIPYEQLQRHQKVAYDQHKLEMRQAESLAENEARVQVSGIDSRCVTEQARLLNEEGQAKAERTQSINASKTKLDQDVAVFLERATKQREPIENSFRSSIFDLNSRYQSYLRIIGVSH